LIEKGIDLSDYVFNNDWNATVLKKVKEYVEEVMKILQSDEFKKNEEAMKLVAKIISVQARENK
jgi:negative regulator of replication initiation